MAHSEFQLALDAEGLASPEAANFVVSDVRSEDDTTNTSPSLHESD